MMMIVRHSFCFRVLFVIGCERRSRDFPSQSTEAEHFVNSPVISLNSHVKEIVMGSTADKIKGAANEAIGKAKQGLGEATGSDQLKGEGAIQEAKGHGQKAVGNAKDAAKEAVNKAAELANRKL
jgi:uncharacterized protein YjbJ (UPF0337 family)